MAAFQLLTFLVDDSDTLVKHRPPGNLYQERWVGCQHNNRDTSASDWERFFSDFSNVDTSYPRPKPKAPSLNPKPATLLAGSWLGCREVGFGDGLLALRRS